MSDKVELSESTPIIRKEKDTQGAHHVGGLSVTSATIFLIGELIGLGALALPNSLARSGYAGILTLCGACAIAIYNGTQLGWCWTILLERHPEYRTHCRYPYAAIGERAIGKWMRYVVTVAIGFTCFGTCVLFLLIAAENLHSVMAQIGFDLNFCVWMIIVAGLLVPISWFRSPKDFLWVAIGAFITASSGLILVFVQLMMELPIDSNIKHAFPTKFKSYFLSFGAILFAFAGACTFPTIQHDMKEPKRFPTALATAYIYGLGVYTVISVSGYYVYGETVSANILLTLPNSPLKITALLLYVFHLIFAYILFVNPPVQNLEDSLNIPNTKYNWKSLLFRTALVCGILFFGETIPHFGALLDLLGGSTSAFLTFIAPPVFYLFLCKNGFDSDGKKRYVPAWIKILNVFVCVIGTIAGCTSTYAAISELSSPNTFVLPCYVNSTAAQLGMSAHHVVEVNMTGKVGL